MPMPVTNCSGEGSLDRSADPPPPSATLPHPLPSPLPLAPPLNPSPLRSSGSVRRERFRAQRWEQPGLNAKVTPVSVGCGRPARPTHPCGGLPAANRPATCGPPPPYLAPRRPQSRLWGPRGGAGLRHPPGLCVSSTSGRCLGVEFLLSLSGEMSGCGERGRV